MIGRLHIAGSKPIVESARSSMPAGRILHDEILNSGEAGSAPVKAAAGAP